MILAQQQQPFVRWDWIFDHLDDIWKATVEHLFLTGIAVGVGLVLSMGLTMVALRFRRSYTPITWVAGIVYSIPSLALFAFLVPVTGLSTLTAEIGLVGYTLLILVRNMVAGIDGVPSSVKEAAAGMGYTRRRQFWRIEVPLALPVIMAGIRIATVTTIGLVTVTSLIGQGGLGALILRGLGLIFGIGPTMIVAGTLVTVALATIIDLALVVLERVLTPWSRRRAPA